MTANEYKPNYVLFLAKVVLYSCHIPFGYKFDKKRTHLLTFNNFNLRQEI